MLVPGGMITIILAGPSGSITSDLKFQKDDPDYDPAYNASIDAVESLVLAHACAGMDVESAQYQEGLHLTLETIADLSLPEEKHSPEPPCYYEVTVNRTSYASKTLSVIATEEPDAKRQALELAGGMVFSEQDAEYEVVNICKAYPGATKEVQA